MKPASFSWRIIWKRNPADTNGPGWTPLHFDATNIRLGVCQEILKYLTDQNPKSNDGITPLQLMEKAKSLGALFTQQQCGIIQTNK